MSDAVVWEYATAVHGHHEEDGDETDWLNTQGETGWECYHVSKGSHSAVFYFKRRKNEWGDKNNA